MFSGQQLAAKLLHEQITQPSSGQDTKPRHLLRDIMMPPSAVNNSHSSPNAADLIYSKPLRKLGFSIDSIVGVKREAASPPSSPRSNSPPTSAGLRRQRSWSPPDNSPSRAGGGSEERARSRSPRWSVSPPPFTGKCKNYCNKIFKYLSC